MQKMEIDQSIYMLNRINDYLLSCKNITEEEYEKIKSKINEMNIK